jgi:hypothetical protein
VVRELVETEVLKVVLLLPRLLGYPGEVEEEEGEVIGLLLRERREVRV